jgi:hypothetical protein
MTLMTLIGLFLIQTCTANRPSAVYKEGCSVHNSSLLFLSNFVQYPSWYFLITANMTQNLQTTLLFSFSATDRKEKKKAVFLDS